MTAMKSLLVASQTTNVRQCRLNRALRANHVVARAAQQPSEAEMKEAMDKAMADPAVQERMKAMQEAMQKPETQAMVGQMQAMMQNEEMQKKVQSLKDDPELKEMFDDIQKGGMAALMKYWNDPEMLKKFGEKMGDVPQKAVAAAGGGGPVGAAAPEINSLLDAAKYGDMEAAEDFIAVGRDVNEADKEGRTPLHYASAYNRMEILDVLIGSEATLDPEDSKQNTPLHYAAGYGRLDAVKRLVSAGASKTSKNSTGKTPLDLLQLFIQESKTPEETCKEAVELLS